MTETKEESSLSERMLLPEFVKKYSQSFPLHIKVLKGYCGPSSRLTISTSDTYNIHFIKHTKVVAIKDAHNTPYSIPLNSAIEFGMVYDPNNNHSEAVNGLTFGKVSKIIGLPIPPKVFCALEAFQGEDEKSTLFDDEILVVKQVLKSRFKSKRALKVYSLLTQSEKLLQEDCSGHFTTQPFMVRMHLPEMIEHVINPFPHQAIIFFGAEVYQNPEMEAQVQDLASSVLSKVITMCHCMTETSLIASSLVTNKRRRPYCDCDAEGADLFDIPVNDENLAGIEVAVLTPNTEEETEQLYDDTRSIVEQFNPTRVRSCKDTGSEYSFTAQSLFYSVVRPGCEKMGVEIDTPSSIYVNVQIKCPPLATPPSPPIKPKPQNQKVVQQTVKQHVSQQHMHQTVVQQHMPQTVAQQHMLQTVAQQHMPQTVAQQHMPQTVAQQNVSQMVAQQHMSQTESHETPSQPQAASELNDDDYETGDHDDEVFEYDEVPVSSKEPDKPSIANEAALSTKLSEFQSSTKALEMRITSLESQSKKQTQVTTDLQTVKSSVDQLAKQMEGLEAKYQQLSVSQLVSHARPLADMNGGEHDAASSVETNMSTLRSMNILQVIDSSSYSSVSCHTYVFMIIVNKPHDSP